MRNFQIIATISLILVLFQFCSSKKKNVDTDVISKSNVAQEKTPNSLKHTIIIYGSKTCPHCVDFLKKMEDRHIPFIFKDVDEDKSNFDEMYQKIKAIKYAGYINYPVLDVDGKILVRPEFEDLLAMLK